MKVVAIVGNNRKDSYNKKLAVFMKERYKDKLEIEIVPIDHFPMYNQDDEFTPDPAVIEAKQKITASDGVFIATPEYNHSVPAVLKNALEWFSRVDKVLVKKPVMIAGISTGILGTVRGQEHLRQILHALDALTLPGNEVFIGSIRDKMDEQGNIIHAPTLDFLDKVVKNFVEWIEKTKHF